MRATIKKTGQNLALGIILAGFSLSSYATSDGTCGIGYINSILVGKEAPGNPYFDVLVDNAGFIAPTFTPSVTHYNGKPYIRIFVADDILWESMLKQAQMAMATRMAVRIDSHADTTSTPPQFAVDCVGTSLNFNIQPCINEGDCNYGGNSALPPPI